MPLPCMQSSAPLGRTASAAAAWESAPPQQQRSSPQRPLLRPPESAVLRAERLALLPLASPLQVPPPHARLFWPQNMEIHQSVN